MLRSFYAGISGLRNHQQAMDVVGNNLANVNTAGYKASRTTFMDTLSQTVAGARAGDASSGGQNPMQVGLGMTVAAIDRDMNQGALQSTGRTLDLAIEGEGWFVVGGTDPLTGDDSYAYTRAGSFFVDDQANLVSSNGDMLYGWVDTDSSGTVDASRDEMGFINLDRRGDGAITNALASSTPAISGPNLGDASLGVITTTPDTTSDTWRVECTDAATGTFRISGTHNGVIATVPFSTPVNDSRLGEFNIIMNTPAQARLDTTFAAGAGALGWTANDFGAGGNDLRITMVNGGAQQIQTEVTVSGSAITVYLKADATGNVTSTAQEVYDAFTNSTSASALVTMDDPAAGGYDAMTVEPFTQVYLTNGAGADLGDYFTFATTAPGGATLQSLSVNREGGVIGVFENGTTEELARVALAKPPNPQGLLAVGQGKFVESPASGSGFPPVAAGTEGTGGIASGFLEMSNVDMTREFTEMIVNQRGFQANSRIITTSDEMLQELLSLKR